MSIFNKFSLCHFASSLQTIILYEYKWLKLWNLSFLEFLWDAVTEDSD